MLIGDRLATAFNQNSEGRFIRYLGRDIPSTEALAYIQRLSYFLQNHIGHRKRVGVFLHVSPHIFYSQFALAATANTMVPLNPEWSDGELAEATKKLGLHALLIGKGLQGRTEAILRTSGKILPILEIESRRCGEYDSRYRLPPAMSPSDQDIVALMPTEGRSGPRNWVPYTHAMLQAQSLSYKAALRLTPQDTVLASGINSLEPSAYLHAGLLPLLNGVSIALSDRTTPDALVPEAVTAGVTHLILRPQTAFDFFKFLTSGSLSWPQLKSVSLLKCHLPAAALRELRDSLNGVRLLRPYGSVENGYLAAVSSGDETDDLMGSGSATPGFLLRILDADGGEVPPGDPSPGEIVVSGPGVATSYDDDSEISRRTFRGNWFFSGDLGRLTENGTLVWLRRKLNCPLQQGAFFSPSDLEQKLRFLPGVRNAIMLGIRNRLDAPVNVLLIEKRDPDGVCDADIQDLCERHFDPLERPDHIVFLPEFPYDRWAQINVRELQKTIQGRL